MFAAAVAEECVFCSASGLCACFPTPSFFFCFFVFSRRGALCRSELLWFVPRGAALVFGWQTVCHTLAEGEEEGGSFVYWFLFTFGVNLQEVWRCWSSSSACDAGVFLRRHTSLPFPSLHSWLQLVCELSVNMPFCQEGCCFGANFFHLFLYFSVIPFPLFNSRESRESPGKKNVRNRSLESPCELYRTYFGANFIP